MEQLGIIIRYLEDGIPRERVLLNAIVSQVVRYYAKILQFLSHVNRHGANMLA